jgi:hypothetical protein
MLDTNCRLLVGINQVILWSKYIIVPNKQKKMRVAEVLGSATRMGYKCDENLVAGFNRLLS